jgi:fatty acid desaturase
VLVLGHLANCVLFFSLGLWMIPVVTTFGIFYGGMLRFFCNAAQHAGLADKVDDFRLNSRTFEAHPIIQFLYWQMNYHIEHHMYAAVPFYNLAALHREIENELPPTPRGLCAVWRQIFAINRRQQKDPGYVYYAPLPE